MDTILSNEEIDELKTISDFLNMNDEIMQKLGYTLYASKYQDRLSKYITNINEYVSAKWFGNYTEYSCTFRHYPSYKFQFHFSTRLGNAIIMLINDIKWEQTFI